MRPSEGLFLLFMLHLSCVKTKAARVELSEA